MSEPAATPRPLPALQGLTGEFYAWCAQGELRFQRCDACGAWRHVPREICAACGGAAWSWTRSSGRGRIFTWTVAARAMHPGFAADAPYAPVVVEMEEGVRLVSLMVDCPPDALAIDMPVEVVFVAASPEVTLPKFRRA
ncbi:MAG: OB-fold domain-containing protein [Deltaproteobacteria bacterium]|nr:OB-fold domain-containing protein [Deltaproteobacteria bacterium]